MCACKESTRDIGPARTPFHWIICTCCMIYTNRWLGAQTLQSSPQTPKTLMPSWMKSTEPFACLRILRVIDCIPPKIFMRIATWELSLKLVRGRWDTLALAKHRIRSTTNVHTAQRPWPWAHSDRWHNRTLIHLRKWSWAHSVHH